MSGPVHTPYSSRKKAMAFANQSAPGTPATLTSADCLDVSSVSYAPQSRTTEDPRYTGTIHRPGDILLGVSYDVTFEWLIHGFGGGLPAANAFIAGRILQAWGFTEQRFVRTEGAYTGGTATAATLGAAEPAVADAYNGYLIGIGSGTLERAMIRDYTAGKVATLARSRSGFAATGTYVIPSQLAYTLSATEYANPASITIWEGDNAGSGHRLNFIDMRPTAATIELVTSARDGGGDFCKLTGTFSGILYSEANEAPPVVTTDILIPPFRDGIQDIANVQLGGSSVTIDLGITSSAPPNPNQLDGSDPGVIVGTKRTVAYELNKVGRGVIDWNALAAAQTELPSQFIWGTGANQAAVMIEGQRFDYRSSGEGSDFLTTSGSAWIDGVDKALSIVFCDGDFS